MLGDNCQSICVTPDTTNESLGRILLPCPIGSIREHLTKLTALTALTQTKIFCDIAASLFLASNLKSSFCSSYFLPPFLSQSLFYHKMPSLPLRIAILECGTTPPNAARKYGSYGGVFASLLRSGADALSYPNLSSSSGLSISTFDVVKTLSYPALQDIDAILLTASASNAFDNDPWILKLVAFVKEILEQRRVRIVAACFGHQIVGRALGTKVRRSDKGWEIGVTPIELTKRGQEIFGQSTLVSTFQHTSPQI